MRVTTPIDPPRRQLARLSGVQCMVLSAFFFSLMSLSVKVAGERIPTFELMFARGLLVTVVVGLDLARRRVPLREGNPVYLLMRGLVGFAALGLFYFAVVRLPLAEATVIHFTNPLFTALIAAAFLGERLRAGEVALALLGLAGVAIMVRPQALLGAPGGQLPLVPVAASLTAALLAGVAYTLVRHLRRHDAMVVVFYFAGITSLIALPLMLPTFVWPRGSDWPMLIAVGVTTLFGQIFLTLGLQRERAGRATIVAYVQIVFATVWGALVFGDLPRPTTLVGAAVIVACTLVLAGRRGAVPDPEDAG
jgi:drug/metabolite transporter (DMT)-like permease